MKKIFKELLKELKVTGRHTLELMVCVAVALLIVKVFALKTEHMDALITIVLAALAKFNRESELSPVPDYVEGK